MTENKRLNPIEKAKANPKSKRAAINAYCFDCSDEKYKDVRTCHIKYCPLWLLRPWQIKKTTCIGGN